MVKDQYANYTVQRMIEFSDDDLKQQLLLQLRPHMSSLRRYTYGKHIASKVDKFVPERN